MRLLTAFALLFAPLVAVALGVSNTHADAHEAAALEPRAKRGLRYNRTAGLLQQRGAGAAAQSRPDSPDFFSEDADHMAELPGYAPGAYKRPHTPPMNNDICLPQCRWKCGTQQCNQVCTPACAPPKCQTVCERREELCETRCGPPQCAVVCPHNECKHPPCAKCMTVCSPPLCTTECGEKCQNICAKPLCTWNCHQTYCPQPDCHMMDGCNVKCDVRWPKSAANQTTPPPFGEVAQVEGVASLDPAVLIKPVTAPPPWETTMPPATAVPVQAAAVPNNLRPNLQKGLPPLPQPVPGFAAAAAAAAANPLIPSGLAPPPKAAAVVPANYHPVRDLKLKWAKQDARNRAREADED